MKLIIGRLVSSSDFRDGVFLIVSETEAFRLSNCYFYFGLPSSVFGPTAEKFKICAIFYIRKTENPCFFVMHYIVVFIFSSITVHKALKTGMYKYVTENP